MINNKLISVVIPTFNRSQLILETIDSLLKQTYPNWECIIVDDGSTDDTKEILKEILSIDTRFSLHEIANSGPSKAREFGLLKTSGNFIQFLDSDDLLPANRFEKCIEEIDGFDFLVTNFDRFINKDSPFLPPYCVLSQELLTLNKIVLEWDESFTIPIHCGFFNAKIFRTVKMETSLQMYEDWLMWIDILLKGYEGKFINECLAHYRFSHPSLSFQFERRTKIVEKAYKNIYNKISPNLQKDFFNVIVNRLCNQLADAYAANTGKFAKNESLLIKVLKKIKRVFN